MPTDQRPRSAASDLGPHCLSIALLRVSRLKWQKPPRSKALILLQFFSSLHALQPSHPHPIRVMSSAVSLSNNTFT